jgi:WD40 repeat protein
MRGETRFAALLLILVTGCGPTPPSIVERGSLKGHTREVVSIAVSPDGRFLASRGADGVRLWELPGGSLTATIPADGSDFGSVAFSPDGGTIASDKLGLGAALWEVPSGREQATFLLSRTKPTQLGGLMGAGWGLAFSPDGKTLAGGGSHGGEDGFLAFWNVADGQNVEVAAGRRAVTAVAYSPDGRTIASAAMDGKLVLWDAATHAERKRIEASRSYLAPITFSPDGRLVASADERRYIRFWDVATGALVATLTGHIKAILSLAFSPDGKLLVSGDSGGTLFVWEPVGRRTLAILETKRGKVWGLTFTPDGRTLVSAGEDKIVHLWDVTWPEAASR